MRVEFAWWCSGASLDIFLQVPLLDKAFYNLFELVAFLLLISLNFMKLAPIMRIRPHDVCPGSQGLGNVMHMYDLSPYILLTGIQRSEAYDGFSTSFKCYYVPHGRRVLVPSWEIFIGSALFCMLGLLLSISLLVIDVMFHSRYYFSQVCRWPLDEGLVEVYLPKTVSNTHIKFS